MFGSIIAIFGTIKALLTMAALGAGVGGLSWCAARIIPGLSGLVIACVVGGAVVIGTGGAGYFTATSNCADQAKFNALQLEKAKVEQQLEVERSAAAVQDEVLAEQAETLAENEKVLDKLQAAIASHEGDAECVLHPDELEAIGEIQ